MINYPSTFEMPTADPLTGLLSPAYFRHLLREKLIQQAQETGDPLSFFLMDTDSFHELNVAHGRQAGDAVLLGVTKMLRATLPARAAIVRYGGDEFGGALPDTRLDDAFTIVEELRRQIAAMRLEDWPDLTITCSVGLAVYPANGSTDIELVREADQALYLAKATGRNKVSLPLSDDRMITKTSYYTRTQLERLAALAKTLGRNEASLLREALDDVLKKYNDQLGAPPPK